MTTPDARFERLLDLARTDPRILAFWLDGSRGKGHETAASDYDCTLVVSDEAAGAYGELAAEFRDGFDLVILTLDQFREAAAWGGPDAWNRYNFTHLTPLVDKTGEIAALMREKSVIPTAEVQAFIAARLDHFTNQIYRALKCRRDGRLLAAELEASEAVGSLLDALFALNGGRLRPYYKYLEWELETHPLEFLPRPAAQLVPALLALRSDAALQRELFEETQRLFRHHGYGAVFDAWGDAALAWMAGEPPATRT